MINKVKRHLILLFGTVTSLILSLVVFLLFLSNQSEHKKMQEELYQTNVSSIIDNLAQTAQINTSWIAKIQAKSNMLVLINDNGNFLHLLNTYRTPIDSMTLISELTTQAEQDGFQDSRQSSTPSVKRSSTYEWHMDQPTYYRGTIASYNTTSYHRTLYLIGVIKKERGQFLIQALPYLLLTILGSVLLFVFSSISMKHILSPVEEGQKKQAEFISSVSHELKSPLSVISAGIYNLHILLNTTPVKDSALSSCRKSLPAIQNECSRASRLINDMLLLAAIDTKSWTLDKIIIDMDTMMIDLYDHYLSLEETLQNKFQFDLPEEKLYQIQGDPERIRQIITILIDNAIRYTDPLRGIRIRCYNHDSYLHIEVEDYGNGIPDSKKALIFQRFYRSDTSRNQKQNFGLGLSIAKELTLLHNGKIYVKDTIGGGATFCVDFPSVN